MQESRLRASMGGRSASREKRVSEQRTDKELWRLGGRGAI